MKTSDMIPVITGETPRITERYPDLRSARAARQRASLLLRGAIDRNFMGFAPKHRAPVERINGVKAYLDPQDPCLLVCGMKDTYITKPYQRVLTLAVGQGCNLDLPGTGIDSVKARLKQLAAQVEAEMGVRPCWQVQFGRSNLSPTLNRFRVTRLPDDYSPVTGEPRQELTGARGLSKRAAWARMNRLTYEYDIALGLAEGAGEPRPQCPQELLDLAAEHYPADLPYLRGEATPQ